MPTEESHSQWRRRRNKSRRQSQWFLEDKIDLLCSLVCSSSRREL